ncbi:MAG: rhomboid family intramembrane serine protease [Gammaproteobacteria bacterium]
MRLSVIPLRDDTPTTRYPIVTVSLIVASSLAFLWTVSLPPHAQQAVIIGLGLIPARLLGGAELPADLALASPPMTVLSSMFLHGGWMHLIGNMLYLWIFGNNVEDAMGHVRFIVFYLLCGLAAALSQALPEPDSTIPMIGASGAVSGVLGAYLLLHPHARVLVLIPIGFILRLIELPAMVVLGLWFGLQLISELFAAEGAGVAFRAHIGGFVAGMILIPFFRRRGVRLFAPPQERWRRF